MRINIDDLPEEVKTVGTHDGTVIDIGNDDTLKITISEDALDHNGTIELVLLDDEGVSLAPVTLQALAGELPYTTGGESAGRPIFIC